MPAAIDEQRGLVEIALLTRHPGQLDQAELDLRVASDPLDAALAEDLADVVGGSHRHLHELVGPAGPCPGHGSLEHVAIAVELVAPFQVAVPIRLARSPEDGVQIAILLLGGRRSPLVRSAKRRSASAEPDRPTSQAAASMSL